MHHDGEAAANASTALSLPLPSFAEPVIVAVRWVANGRTLAEDCAWPEPFRYHRFATADIAVVREPAARRICLSADVPVKGLWLAGSGLRFGDNFLDLLPGVPRFVAVEGDLNLPLHVTALDQPTLIV
jgi:beta-mannosidase